MNKEELKQRTKKFSLEIIKLVELIPNTKVGHTIANQIVRSATSVGANYRATCRAKSDRDFLYKIQIVEEEADETLFWLELLKERKMLNENLLDNLIKECDELVAIFTATAKTVRNKINAKKKKNENIEDCEWE
jgi:four helix bundle protein